MADIRKMYTDFQKEVYEDLTKNHYDSYVILNRLTPPKPDRVLDLNQINTYLTQLFKTTLLTLCTSTFQRNLEVDMTNEYYRDVMEQRLDIITYSIISVMSPVLGGQLLYYIDRSFIYNYIKMEIVKRNLIEIVDEVKDIIERKTLVAEEQSKISRLYDLTIEIINKYMVHLDMSHLKEDLDELIKTEVKNKSRVILNAISGSKIYVPSILKDIILNQTLDLPRHEAFMTNYIKTHTLSKFKTLLMQYKDADANADTIENTLHERQSYHGVSQAPVIDGLVPQELLIADRLLKQASLPNDTEIIDNNTILFNIRKIIEEHKTYTEKAYIKDEKLIIVNPNGKEEEFDFLSTQIKDQLNDSFIVFGVHRNKIRNTFLNNPARSCLTQTGLTVKQERDMIMNPSLSNKVSSMSVEQRIEHRRKQIRDLISKFTWDQELMSEVNLLKDANNKQLKYIDMNKSSYYRMSDEKRLLLVLAETEGLYNKLTKEVN